MKSFRRTLALSAALVAISACSQDRTSPAPELGSATVAVVNGKPIAESVMRIYTIATEGQNLEDLAEEDRERILNDVIGLELLAQQAEEEGLTDSRSLAAQIELQRLQLIARAMATDFVQKNPPSEADIQAVYDENLPRLAGRQFKARHILVPTKEEADRVIANLREGADFVALAEERADGPTGPNGGSLDWFTLDSMPPAFANAVQSMGVGTYTPEPVETEFGFHVILLEDTREQEPPSLEALRADLSDAAERKRLDEYIQRLREEATVTVE